MPMLPFSAGPRSGVLRIKQVDDQHVRASCLMCGGTKLLPVTPDQIRRWRTPRSEGGEYIQAAMPNLSAADRELLISGTCGSCFDSLFGGDDDN